MLMKKTLFALASVAILISSCTKENISISEVADNNFFTCTLESDSKTSLDPTTGTPKWEVGDYIIFYNGEKANSASKTGEGTILVQETNATKMFYVSGGEKITNNIIERIDITADMISADGKTVSFQKHIDDATQNYYAVVESKGAALVYAIKNTGLVTFREASSHVDAERKLVHAAVAKCSKDKRELTFKNTFCQVKFTVPAGKYSKVTFEANTGSTNKFVCGMNNINFSDGICGDLNNNKQDPYTITLSKEVDNAPYYVPVAQIANLDKGIVIKCYTSDSDTEPYTVTTTKAFPVARNRVIDLGDLEQATPITSYYDAYQAGRNISINGVAYNKATYGDGKHITADTDLTGDCKGLIFVDEGKKLNVASNCKPLGDMIILCDKPGKKATLAIASNTITPKSESNLIFSNIEFSITKNAILYGNSVKTIGFYDCKFLINVANFSLSATTIIRNINLINCDIATSQGFGLISGVKNAKTENVILKNCQIYSTSTASNPKLVFRFCTNKWNATDSNIVASTMGNVDIENNTFYNINWTQSYYHGMVNPLSVDKFVLKKNIFAFSSSNSEYLRVLYLSSDTDTAYPGYPSEGTVADNLSWNNSGRHYGCYNASTRLSWYSSSYKEFTNLSASPFTAVDITTGTFTKNAQYASYGATR